MEINHFSALPIYNQQVLFISFSHFHFHALDAPALKKYIRNIPKDWGENSDSSSSSSSSSSFSSNSNSDSDCSIF